MEFITEKREGNRHLAKIEECERFFEELMHELGDDYELVLCGTNSRSSYLVPKGTASEITYYGKPMKSFRIGNAWNWYANINTCDDEWHVQCLNYDLPFTKNRRTKGVSGMPIRAMQVAYKDGESYRCVYGEKYDRETRHWTWITSDPKEVAESIKRG